jgi:hypothetical protein
MQEFLVYIRKVNRGDALPLLIGDGSRDVLWCRASEEIAALVYARSLPEGAAVHVKTWSRVQGKCQLDCVKMAGQAALSNRAWITPISRGRARPTCFEAKVVRTDAGDLQPIQLKDAGLRDFWFHASAEVGAMVAGGSVVAGQRVRVTAYERRDGQEIELRSLEIATAETRMLPPEPSSARSISAVGSSSSIAPIVARASAPGSGYGSLPIRGQLDAILDGEERPPSWLAFVVDVDEASESASVRLSTRSRSCGAAVADDVRRVLGEGGLSVGMLVAVTRYQVGSGNPRALTIDGLEVLGVPFRQPLDGILSGEKVDRPIVRLRDVDHIDDGTRRVRPAWPPGTEFKGDMGDDTLLVLEDWAIGDRSLLIRKFSRLPVVGGTVGLASVRSEGWAEAPFNAGVLVIERGIGRPLWLSDGVERAWVSVGDAVEEMILAGDITQWSTIEVRACVRIDGREPGLRVDEAVVVGQMPFDARAWLAAVVRRGARPACFDAEVGRFRFEGGVAILLLEGRFSQWYLAGESVTAQVRRRRIRVGRDVRVTKYTMEEGELVIGDAVALQAECLAMSQTEAGDEAAEISEFMSRRRKTGVPDPECCSIP